MLCVARICISRVKRVKRTMELSCQLVWTCGCSYATNKPPFHFGALKSDTACRAQSQGSQSCRMRGSAFRKTPVSMRFGSSRNPKCRSATPYEPIPYEHEHQPQPISSYRFADSIIFSMLRAATAAIASTLAAASRSVSEAYASADRRE